MENSNNKSILFLSPCALDKALSQCLKDEQYNPYLLQEGYKLETSSFIDEKFWEVIYKKGFLFNFFLYTLKGCTQRILILFRERRLDVVYAHLWITSFGSSTFEYLVSKFSKNIVYYVTDLIHLKGSKHGKLRSKMPKGKSETKFSIKHSKHIITITSYLDSYIRQLNNNTTNISSTTIRIPISPSISIQTMIKLFWGGVAAIVCLLSSIYYKIYFTGCLNNLS